jgi:hypothetical protein
MPPEAIPDQGRRLVPHNNSRQLGALRDLPDIAPIEEMTEPNTTDGRIARAERRMDARLS